jgi:signal transduction histidine kinase/DNA-binding response OmpR family regulator
MNRILLLMKVHFKILLLTGMLFIVVNVSTFSRAINLNSVLQNETDSVFSTLDRCTIDTCRFQILSDFFWRYANYDLARVRQIGIRAFEEIRRSDNLRARSNGYDIKGVIYRDDDNLDSAYYCFTKALEYAKLVGFKFRIGWSYFHLGEIGYRTGNYTVALENMKNARKYFKEIGPDPVISKSNFYISEMYERIGQYDSVLVYYNKQLAADKARRDTVGEIITTISLSQFYKNRNNSAKSLDYLKYALKKADEVNSPKALISVYLAIGGFYIDQKQNYTIALNYYNRVLEIAEKHNDKQLETSLYNTIGNIYYSEGNDSLALEFNLKSLALAKELKHRHSISNAYRSLGFIYNRIGNDSLARNYFKTCYETGCNSCPLIKFHEALVEIGNIYFKMNEHEQSLYWYRKSLDLAEKFHSLKDIALSKLLIGNHFRSVGQPSVADKFYSEALLSAEEIGSISLIKSIADTLSSFYKTRNNYASAYRFKHLSGVMSDSLYKIDRQADMTELEMRFEFEKTTKENEAKLAISSEEIKKQKVYRNAILVIAIMMVGIGLTIFISYRRKKRDNLLLHEQKDQIEKKNREIQDQVHEITIRNNEIERISNELHASDEMKLRFFSNISHELRTPLTLIINPVERLLKTKAPVGDEKKQLEYIYNNAQKLHDLTNQIMDLQKLDAGNLQLLTEQADIIQYCLGIASSFESLCHKKNNNIKFTSNHRSVLASFDKDKTGKILTNLLSNAFKFCYKNSTIEISIEILDNNFNLTITDKGPGIPEEQINNVFRRYFQVPSESQVSGTGIGLAYVKELAGFMKGDVSIKSVVNTGTKVRISIPVGDCGIIDPNELSIEIPDIILHPKRNENGYDVAGYFSEDEHESTVLIVEDNDELRHYIADLLKSEFNVVLACDGNDGMNKAFQNIPDIILSDVMMPGPDGYKLCALLKKDERTSHIPLILLTARDNIESSLDGYRTGADDYIIKPFNDEVLTLKIKNIISTHEAARKQFDFKSLLKPEGIKVGNTDKKFMKKCLSVIDSHIDNPDFGVEFLASELAFSNRNFYRKIKAITNLTPAEMIRMYRLYYAKQLLQNSKMKVFQIALAVGYEDTGKFRQAFKKQFGFSPTETLNKVID